MDGSAERFYPWKHSLTSTFWLTVKSTYYISCADSKFSISQFINVGAIKSLIFGCKQVFRKYLLFWNHLLNKNKILMKSVVSEEKILFKLHPPFFLICIIGQNRQKFKVHKKSRKGQFQPNFVWMILRWSPFKIVSVSAVLYPRWPRYWK
jgi:hypothetical protein